MSWLTQVFVAVMAGFILAAGSSIMNQWVIASRVKQRLDDTEKKNDERHEENKKTLDEIRNDVKRINGTVGRHDTVLLNHATEIDRLRDAPRRTRRRNGQ